jgi:hypothetical protein
VVGLKVVAKLTFLNPEADVNTARHRVGKDGADLGGAVVAGGGVVQSIKGAGFLPNDP